MYCPACSSPATDNQKFCRSCGLSLEGLAERIAAQQGTTPATRNEISSRLIAVGKWMAFGGLGALLLTITFALLSVAFGLLSEDTLEFYAMKVIAISLTLMVLGGGTLCLPMFLQRGRRPALPTKSTPTSMPTTTVELAGLQPPTKVESVTEATTRNLQEARLPADRRQHE